MITVLTPSYNRAAYLEKLYISLLNQDFNDFEWVVVDDGSTDATGVTVDRFVCEGKMKITYVKQNNGGKHRALNRGVKEANGSLVLIVDSDDSLPEDALSTINKYYLKIKDNPAVGGVCGVMAHHDGTVIGRRRIAESMDLSSIDMRYRYGFEGDVCEVFKTEVLREYPFPEINNERFCPEALVWNRIARKYQLRFFDKVIYFRDYLAGGLTSKIVRIRMDSPVASMICYAELNELDIPARYKMKAAINYWRFRLCFHGRKEYPRLRGRWNLVAPLGWLAHLTDLLRIACVSHA